MTNSITRQAIIDEATKRGWEITNATEAGAFYWVSDDSGRRKLFRGARADSLANGRNIAQDKQLTYSYLRQNGYEIPDYIKHDSIERSVEFLQKHRTVVVKPADSEQSKGVTVDVTDQQKLVRAIDYATSFSPSGRAVLQEQLDGKLYRLLVVGDKLFAAAYRRSAYVTGDGVNTVRQLIEIKNAHPWRSGSGATPLKPISITSASEYIGPDALDEVLDGGVEKELLAIASVSLGGEAEDVTDKVNPETAKLVASISQELGLSICGFDIMCEDISEPFDDGYLPVVELNSLPGLKLHLFPTAGGIVRNPAALVLDNAFGIDSNR